MKGSCHCGNTVIVLQRKIELVTSCNCSICHRYGAIWAYFSPESIDIQSRETPTQTYVHGDKLIDFHQCSICGCTTHYTPTAKGKRNRMAVNLRMFERSILDKVNIRYFDGADTWQFYDKP